LTGPDRPVRLHDDPRRAARPTVLVVDDEPDILVALEDLLEEDYRVLATNSPEDALAILEREPAISVIVSDQRMPGMTGDVFLGRARRLSDAQALLLTGYADLSAGVSAVNEGRISGYAHKPWEPAALLAMVRQAAGRAMLQAELRWERTLLRGLMDGTADAVSIKDRDGRFLRLNRATADRLARRRRDCLGRTEAELLPGPAGAAILAADLRAMETGRVEIEQRQDADDEAPSGFGRWVQRLRAPVRDETGAIAALATLERDVSDEKRMEAQLRQADKMQALGTMASGVAHDFNNLLTAILGSLEMARRHADDVSPRLRRLLDTAQAAAERGAGLTRRLLSFSRQQEVAVCEVEPAQLLRNMHDLVVRSVARTDIRVGYDIAPDLPLVRVDPEQLELALLNLCVNARDAMPEGGRITLGAGLVPPEALEAALRTDGDTAAPAAGPFVAISVRDEGVGMSPELQARIFEPFFTTKEVGRGTGLGLAMVYALARQSGGAMLVDSAPGRGSLISICLPSVAQTET
jgi:PAS domain S-box-containing protein